LEVFYKGNSAGNINASFIDVFRQIYCFSHYSLGFELGRLYGSHIHHEILKTNDRGITLGNRNPGFNIALG
jgi:hypothetical protein